MEPQHPTSASALSEWIIAIGVICITFFSASAIKAILKRLRKERDWPILGALAPSLSNILYIVGFKIFADVAPLHGKFEAWIDGAIYVVTVIIVLGFLQRTALVTVAWSASKAHESEALDKGFIPLMRNVITLFIFFSGGIMMLQHFHYDVMSLLTALGVGSLAVGLASKDTLSNMISGFILIIDRNLRPGDRINLGGTVGDVEEIGLRSTKIKMGDGNTLIVPNSDMVNNKILNLSMPSREITCSVPIRVPYSVKFSVVRSVCLSLVVQIDAVAKHKKSWVHLVDLSKGYQLIHVGFWVMEMNDAGAAISDFNERLISKFQKDEIPFIPQNDLSSPNL